MAPFLISLPLKPHAKSRPRVTRHSTYMPKPYQDWRKAFVLACRERSDGSFFDVPFAIAIRFVTPSGKMRPDIDNAAGAVLDALMDAQLIADDGLCRRILAEVVKGHGSSIEIAIEAT